MTNNISKNEGQKIQTIRNTVGEMKDFLKKYGCASPHLILIVVDATQLLGRSVVLRFIALKNIISNVKFWAFQTVIVS